MVRSATALAVSPLSVPNWRAWLARLDHHYFTWLGIVLLGYGTLGKGFAYMGVPPVFVGELTLLAGLVVVGMTCRRLVVLRTFLGWVLLLFIGWGLARTIPYISRYKVDALRDGAVWGYSIYALIVASLLARNPEQLPRLVTMFRWFCGAFLFFAPIACVLNRVAQGAIPALPWAPDVYIIQLKGGDLLVHLTGVTAFIAVMGVELPEWLPLTLVPLLLGLNLQGRAGLVTFLAGFGLSTAFKPFSRFVLHLWLILLLAIGALWISDVHLKLDGDSPRDLSFDQLSAGIVSIFGESNHDALDGSREWRLKWWQTIRNYTFDGRYFWTGKGYGINLADDDGFQVEADGALRNPHNAHMTFLARGGVPGLVIWIGVQAAFAVSIAYGYFRARLHGQWNWVNLFLFIFIYWAAYLTNASFDVFLEGPMGGIWFWSVYGCGMGSLIVFRNQPGVLNRISPSPGTPGEGRGEGDFELR